MLTSSDAEVCAILCAETHMDTQMAWKTWTACGLSSFLRELELLLPNMVIANVGYAEVPCCYVAMVFSDIMLVTSQRCRAIKKGTVPHSPLSTARIMMPAKTGQNCPVCPTLCGLRLPERQNDWLINTSKATHRKGLSDLSIRVVGHGVCPFKRISNEEERGRFPELIPAADDRERRDKQRVRDREAAY